MERSSAMEKDESAEKDGAMEKYSFKTLPERNLTVLKVNSALTMEDKTEFSESCRTLLDCDESNIVVDLVKLDNIFSLFYGSIADLHFEAEKKGKVLTVLCNDNLAQRFDQTSFNKFLRIQVV